MSNGAVRGSSNPSMAVRSEGAGDMSGAGLRSPGVVPRSPVGGLISPGAGLRSSSWWKPPVILSGDTLEASSSSSCRSSLLGEA